MPIKFVCADITKIKCDAIVNAANSSLLGGGGVDGAIHKAAGIDLLNECKSLGGCSTGNAKITKGYKLPCKYVIHTVGPIYKDGKHNEKQLLENCYKNSIELAIKYNCKTVAFPLISSGVYGYPKEQALSVAVDTINECLYNNDLTIFIVFYDDIMNYIDKSLFYDVQSFIKDTYNHSLLSIKDNSNKSTKLIKDKDYKNNKSFNKTLKVKANEKGIDEQELYKNINIDKKSFSKIIDNSEYKPSKNIIIAFAIALKLSIEETDNLLCEFDFNLSTNLKFDLIIKYFITNKIYNINIINEILFAFNEQILIFDKNIQ